MTKTEETKAVEAETAAVEVSGVETEAPDFAQQLQDAEALRSHPQRSLLAQLRTWLATVPDDHPYDGLVRLAREAGWDWLLRQANVAVTDSTVTVTFDVLIGRSGMDAEMFEWVDRASIMLPASPGPISVGARLQIAPTIIYMIFGRLPPQRQAAAPAPKEERVVEMADEDVSLDEPAQMNGRDDIDPMVTGADVPAWEPGVGLPDVVVERVDGVPVFADLDDVQAPSADIIVAVTNEINAALVRMTTADQVMEMWNRNAPVFNWLQDFATPEQRSAIKGAFARRKGQIEGGFGSVTPPAGRRGAVN